MPKDLILNSLEIQRFRCFRELRIGHLGRVNLIVGKNNVGKSTILEALRLFAKPGSLADLLEIFSIRNEVLAAELDEWSRSHIPFLPVHSLFFDRKASPEEESAITIGPIDSQNETLRIILHVNYAPLAPIIHSIGPEKDIVREVIPGSYASFQSLLFRVGPATRAILANMTTSERLPSVPDNGNTPSPNADSLNMPIRDVPFHALGPDGLSRDVVIQLWDAVSLSSFEKDVIEALRIISPEIERVATKGPGGRIKGIGAVQEAASRVPFAKVGISRSRSHFVSWATA